ncbi:hypothetical protein [Pantoea agglomerans]|uniref:hypothetical protein n=1 Tax=Enterobacter agglomerans TaxID=549 RepID=UPI0010094208|nr:hypothetical protein [Pantoea agglomerans]QAV45426.1 hypothetical protein D1629_12655 [Pantoea agglomerans]QAV50266.1 hypothetical protein D1628_13665 [Pantoea agglomerans]
MTIIVALCSLILACASLKFNYDLQTRQTLNLYIQRCNDATKDNVLKSSRESLGTVITSCCKAHEYIKSYSPPLFLRYVSLKKLETQKTELKNYMWDLLPFAVWEEIIHKEKLAEFLENNGNSVRDKRVLVNQYKDLSRDFSDQIKSAG